MRITIRISNVLRDDSYHTSIHFGSPKKSAWNAVAKVFFIVWRCACASTLFGMRFGHSSQSRPWLSCCDFKNTVSLNHKPFGQDPKLFLWTTYKMDANKLMNKIQFRSSSFACICRRSAFATHKTNIKKWTCPTCRISTIHSVVCCMRALGASNTADDTERKRRRCYANNRLSLVIMV